MFSILANYIETVYAVPACGIENQFLANAIMPNKKQFRVLQDLSSSLFINLQLLRQIQQDMENGQFPRALTKTLQLHCQPARDTRLCLHKLSKAWKYGSSLPIKNTLPPSLQQTSYSILKKQMLPMWLTAGHNVHEKQA